MSVAMLGPQKWFRSTRPRGARQGGRRGAACRRGFDPRAREGRDWPQSRAGLRSHCFDPRAREGRDPPPSRPHAPGCRFDPRAREGRDLRVADALTELAGFDPRAREGRDTCRRLPVHCGSVVSIHAPARGATRRVFLGIQLDIASIHAPARGATLNKTMSQFVHVVFRSTRPRGARPVLATAARQIDGVSIHAPARGATYAYGGRAIVTLWFRSTRPRGARPSDDDWDTHVNQFRSTRPRGARHAATAAQAAAQQVSIHAPARGATAA